LPLYNAFTREAPAVTLGLLPFSTISANVPLGTKQTLIRAAGMSAFGAKADITQTGGNVCF
jgi:hypothetical protein